MSTETTPSPPGFEFRARLTPNRSLSRAGFLLLMCVLVIASFATGMVFLLRGAWPVTGFFGLDVLLVYIAFRANYRSGRQFELVELTPRELTVTRVHASGRTESFGFNPYWVRLNLREWHDGRADLRLGLHGKEISFGRFLSNDEKRDLARALAAALIKARSVSA